jgi:ADP-heptose:LPS heptosyltransferase
MKKKEKTLLTGKYLVKNPFLFSYLWLTDFFFSLFKRRKKLDKTEPPKKILVCNIAHFGDVIIATSVLPVLKKSFPGSKIGFLLGSWSKSIIQDHPLIDNIHVLDHWKLNRSNSSIFKKVFHYLRMKKKLIEELKSQEYDVAIDLYYYFPNAIPILAKAKIPRRIGYISGGFGSLLTSPIIWKNKNHYVTEYYKPLFGEINISPKSLTGLRPSFPSPSHSLKTTVYKKIKAFQGKAFLILHLSGGNSLKEWPEEKWKLLCQKLIQKKYKLVFTGKGKEEEEKINRVIDGLSNCINSCNQLEWNELIYLVNLTKAVISIDSVICHIAGMVKSPLIILFNGMNNHYHWSPDREKVFAIKNEIECFPCYNKNGCKHMSCIRETSEKDLLGLIEI